MKNTNPEKWIEEFDEKWKRVWLHDGNKPVETYTSCEEELKSFIRLKIAEAEARGRSQVVDAIKALEVGKPNSKEDESVYEVKKLLLEETKKSLLEFLAARNNKE